MKRRGKHIFLLALLLTTFSCLPASTANFASFLVNFISHSETQDKQTAPSLTIDGKKASRAGSYIRMSTTTLALVCADSLNAPSISKGEQKMTFSDLQTKEALACHFNAHGSSFQLNKITTNANYDHDFITFLSEYSRNHDLQIKRTIFPIPIRTFKGGKESNSKLLMPREWNFISFSQICPQVCTLNNVNNANNRRIYVYNKGRLSQIYNFICINRKWYLIEVENHQ